MLHTDLRARDIKQLQNNYLKTKKPTYKPKDKEEIQSIASITMKYSRNKYLLPDLNFLDVSHITDLSYTFYKMKNFNLSLDKWDVFKVKDMSHLFEKCENFNQPLNDWNVSNVENMQSIFNGCENFNQPLDKWNVSKVKNMGFMFSDCWNFNQPLNNWDVSKVENMCCMFKNCKKFNQPLDKWNLKNVKNISGIFSNCENYSYNIDWDTPHLEYIQSSFSYIKKKIFVDLKNFKKLKTSLAFEGSNAFPVGELLNYLIKHYNKNIFAHHKFIKSEEDLIGLKNLNKNEFEKVLKILNVLRKI